MEIDENCENSNDSNSKRLEDQHADEMIDYLTSNDEVIFKSQQRGESSLSKSEKALIAADLFDKNKLTFLSRFGRFMKLEHLEQFRQYKDDDLEGELTLLVDSFCRLHRKNVAHVCVRNRRYEALKHLVGQNEYFTEVAMMKRNPLLYEQLVGQYLTANEKLKRDKMASVNNVTLVNILLESVERDEAERKRKEQEFDEDNTTAVDVVENYGSNGKINILHIEPYQQPSTSSHWGEMPVSRSNTNSTCLKKGTMHISTSEKQLLKEEFVTTMYQSFLNGKDTEFDYDTVDNNDSYDNIEEITHDEEEKYFDSEEPDDAIMDETPCINGNKEDESSEDELDIYMSALNQNPTVCELSKNMEKL